MFIGLLILIFLSFMHSCTSLSQKPYCNKVNENPITIDDYRKNEEKYLNCIEDLEIYIKHIK